MDLGHIGSIKMCDDCVCISSQTTPLDKWLCSIGYPLILSVCEIVQQKVKDFVVMWQASTSTLDSTLLSHNKRLAPRERSLEGARLVCVSSAPLSQLWAESFDPSQWIIMLVWSVGESSVRDVPLPSRRISDHHPNLHCLNSGQRALTRASGL